MERWAGSRIQQRLRVPPLNSVFPYTPTGHSAVRFWHRWYRNIGSDAEMNDDENI
jgi:hypothetical protein